MTVIVSQSSFPTQGFEHRFFHGNRYHCLSSKVTLAWNTEGRLEALEQQPALSLHDIWRDQPERSSLLYPSDLIPYKPTTDVLVLGTVRPPQDGPLPMWYASLQVGTLEKRLRIHGPRHWQHRALSGWSLSEPEPTEGVALLYENAFGGCIGDLPHYAEGQYFPDNPVGCGFLDARKADTAQCYRAAQIEAWNAPLREFAQPVRPDGFGPLPAHVPARLQYAGTYDERWQQEVAPNIPLDMDLRYWNTAPADQQPARFLKAGDPIRLAGIRPDGPLELSIPPYEATAVCRYQDGSRQAQPMSLDTVLLDLDHRHMTLRFHTIVPYDPRLTRINLYCAATNGVATEVRHG